MRSHRGSFQYFSCLSIMVASKVFIVLLVYVLLDLNSIGIIQNVTEQNLIWRANEDLANNMTLVPLNRHDDRRKSICIAIAINTIENQDELFETFKANVGTFFESNLESHKVERESFSGFIMMFKTYGFAKNKTDTTGFDMS